MFSIVLGLFKMKLASFFGLAVAALPVLSSAFQFSDVMERSLVATAEIQKRSTISDILADIKAAATCTACEVWMQIYRCWILLIEIQALLIVLKVVAALGNDDFVDVITEVCILAVSLLSPRRMDYEH